MLSGIAILVLLTPVGYSSLSSSHQWDTYCCLLHTSGGIILSPSHLWGSSINKGPFTTQQKVPEILSLSSLLFTHSLCHYINLCKILLYVCTSFNLNKFILYYFTNHCVIYWLILISKRGSLDPNLKRGTFDQRIYVVVT